MDIKEFLKQIIFFGSLSDEEIDTIIATSQIITYKKGEILYKDKGESFENSFIILDGEVLLEKHSQPLATLKKGDFYGIVSLTGEKLYADTAKVIRDDSKILHIKNQILSSLFKKDKDFSGNITDKIHKQTVRDSFNAERLLKVRIKDLKLKKPIFISSELNITETAKKMTENDATFCLVQKDGETGIITERDIIKKVLARELNPSTVKAEGVASFPIISMDSSEPLFNALLTMAKHGIRKLVVKDGGAIWGVLDDRVIISHESKNILFIIKEIEKAKTVADLAYIYSLVSESIIEGVMSGLDPEYVGKYISELNDRFMIKVAQFVEEELGEPPCPYSILVIGSEGRREQTLKTDQDNALIFDGGPEHDGYFEKFSNRFIDYLLRIGFPPCPGKVMINNPYWRKNKKDWFKEIHEWMENPVPEHVVNISIFFDFRNAFGDENLAEELWQFIFERINKSKPFLPFLASGAIKFKPPLGFMSRLQTEREGEHKGEIDIKKYGTFPISQGIRVLSLQHGIRNTNTFERIRTLKKSSVLTSEFAVDLEESYRFTMSLRLKSQAKMIRNNIPPDNYINPKELSRTERKILKECFKKIEEFQKLLFDIFNLRYFS